MSERPADSAPSDPQRHRSLWPRRNGAIDMSTQRFAVPITGLVAVIAITFAAAIAWTKVPDKDDVKQIAQEASRQTAEKQDAKYSGQHKQTCARLEKVERGMDNQNKELEKMSRRVDGLIIMMASGVADDRRQTIEARRKAHQVRSRAAAGQDPFAGTSFDPEAK